MEQVMIYRQAIMGFIIWCFMHYSSLPTESLRNVAEYMTFKQCTELYDQIFLSFQIRLQMQS